MALAYARRNAQRRRGTIKKTDLAQLLTDYPAQYLLGQAEFLWTFLYC
ncbi:hypothetical protein JG559_01820 [Enterococcus faecalis]|uniref:Uncharacterized protein n=1 Tax=Enterococcus faecalis TaxID=1351 RepID=A0A974NZ27_ENTFL|nr:hypothetical protein JG559_01820 [Enterococcus faecalis]